MASHAAIPGHDKHDGVGPGSPARRRSNDYGQSTSPNAGGDLEQPSLSSAEVSGGQDGVKAIEAISMTWTKWGLIAAYFSIFLMAFTTSLEGQVTYSVVAFATSAFGEHSLISTVYTIQGVVNAVIKPPMAKIADVFGRLEAFTLCILLYVLGYIQMAVSNNVETFASAQIFYSAGSQGLATLQQIFIADTSDMPNRALFSSLPDTPFLVTIWIGPLIGTAIRLSSTWRWAYGMWAIILPVTFLPLAVTLFLNSRRARKLGLMAPGTKSFSVKGVARTIWVDLDLLGMILLSAAFGMILVPLTIVAVTPGGWQSPMIIGVIVGGFVSLVLFLLWESWARFVPYPLIPLGLLKSRTFSAGCGIGFFYFMAFYLSVQPYFNSYLLVVHNQSAITAGYITQTFSFTSTVASVVISIIIKYTKHYKYYVVAGSLIYLLGMGLMVRYRTQDATVGTLVGTQIVIGIGGGMLNVPAQLGVQASASHQQVGVATAVFLTLVSIGGAVGSAISGAVWGQLLPAKLAAYLPDGVKDQAGTIYGSVNVASGTWAPGTPERDAINRAYDETMNTLLTIACCICVPVVVLGLLMRNYKLDQMDQGVKGRVIGGEVSADEKKRIGDGQHHGGVTADVEGRMHADGGGRRSLRGRGGPRSWFRGRAVAD
ncbi:major facilitator superfamily domain-containing protein [Microdochium trichocladiopsis]|uniref:Major facilitator superfamily domain-containing protein n=1 Tax=Microdochium trichocladiopsis TaxID=1682393 RepID=A0A9P9BUX9_9PEZI|nr:major facilitator superfamily domain-containing protein [Microdochium trichocladiopsis]KAH7038096.1 major facilitator superfamily domain-containing protein [Microdochium trichocladiopsis]